MRDGQLLEEQNIAKMQVEMSLSCSLLLTSVCSRHIPTIVVQGRYDVVCTVCFSLLLHASFLVLIDPDQGDDCLGTQNGLGSQALDIIQVKHCSRCGTLVA